MANMKNKIFQLLTRIPKGFVVTYGDISKALNSKSPRYVGRVLHDNPNPDKYPCHRVVFADGRLSKSYAFGGLSVQREKLESEGAIFDNERVDMEKCHLSSQGVALRG